MNDLAPKRNPDDWGQAPLQVVALRESRSSVPLTCKRLSAAASCDIRPDFCNEQVKQGCLLYVIRTARPVA